MDSKIKELPKQIMTIVQDLRDQKPALNLSPGASDAERNYAYTNLAAQAIAYQGRIADALEHVASLQTVMLRQRFERGVPWNAFWVVVIFALMAIAALAFALGLK